jgi:hypothetical protein
MPGLVPGIHVFASVAWEKTWMAGTSPAMTKHDTITSFWIAPKKPAPTLQPAKWAAPHRCRPCKRRDPYRVICR